MSSGLVLKEVPTPTAPPAGYVRLFLDQTSGDFYAQDSAGTLTLVATGDVAVVGPASAVADRLAVFDGTTGKLVKDGGVTVAGLATAAQGTLADNAVQPGDPVVINAQTGTAYALVLADAGTDRLLTLDNALAITLTVPTNASVAFAVGAPVDGAQLGAGLVSIAGETGVTINGVTPGAKASAGQWSRWRLVQLATDVWFASGELA